MSADPIDDLCARLCANPWRDIFGEAAAALQRLRAENAELRDSRGEVKADYERACRTVALMHEAATGVAACGPRRGVVEDVEDVRLRAERAEAERDAQKAANADLMEWKAQDDLREVEFRALRAERDTLAAIVRAADAMREFVPICYASTTDGYAPNAAAATYDAARAKWEDKL